jgi:hypothetical protein
MTFGVAFEVGAFTGEAAGGFVSGGIGAVAVKAAKSNVVKSTGELGKIGVEAKGLEALPQQQLARLSQFDNFVTAQGTWRVFG